MTTEEYLAFEEGFLNKCTVMETREKQACWLQVWSTRLSEYIEETQRQRKEAIERIEGLEESAEHLDMILGSRE